MEIEAKKQSEQACKEKLPYSTPEFICYGSLTELTQGGDFFGNDGNTQCTGNADAAQQPCIS